MGFAMDFAIYMYWALNAAKTELEHVIDSGFPDSLSPILVLVPKTFFCRPSLSNLPFAIYRTRTFALRSLFVAAVAPFFSKLVMEGAQS